MPLMYGRTTLDVILDAGFLLVVCLLVFVTLCTNEYEKHLSSIIVSNGCPSSFVQSIPHW